MRQRSQMHGVTLLELMITVGIVAILAAVAYPSYRNQIVRSNRSEARNALLQAAQSLERCYTFNRTYAGCGGIKKGATTTGLYDLTWQDADLTNTTFRITATPRGAQASDTDCAVFEMTAIGRTALNSDKADNSAACWR